MSGNLYQLKTTKPAKVGEIVRVNGPYDMYGVVRELREDGFHLIRGLGRQERTDVTNGTYSN